MIMFCSWAKHIVSVWSVVLKKVEHPAPCTKVYINIFLNITMIDLMLPDDSKIVSSWKTDTDLKHMKIPVPYVQKTQSIFIKHTID